MRKLAPVIALVSLAGCRGCDDPPVAIAPQIYVDVCASPQKEIDGVLIGGFEECAFDFGERPISVKVEQAFKITNPSSVELTLESIELIGDPAFAIELKPETIAPGLSGDLVVTMRPRVEGPIESTIFILSDANNTPQTPESKSLVEIDLLANGVDNGLPDIEITPGDCDFERVPQGGVKLCNVTVSNTGIRGLVLDSVEFIPPGDDESGPLFAVPAESTVAEPFAFTGRPPSPDEEIAPGASVVMPVRFTPDVLGNYQGKFRVLSSDPDEGQIDVGLSGIAVTPPTCNVGIKSVNGAAGETDVEPLDNVVLTVEGSTPATPDGAITGFRWSITDQPAGSQATLSTADLADTGFQFNGGGNVGVDLAGNYCVSAVVIDDLGTESVNECSLCFEAVPKDNFLVQLSWDTDHSDIDLHVTQQAGPDGQFCVTNTGGSVAGGLEADACSNGLDCNYSTCRSTAGSAPEWDGVDGRTEGDPSLDIDDLDGFGPENINIDAMLPGNYLVSVVGFSVDGISGGTVRLFLFGRLAGEFFAEIENHTFWEVALVRWPDGVTTFEPCVEDLTDGTSGDELAACDEE